MKRGGIGVLLAVLAGAALLGSAPCNQGGLGGSIDPLGHYFEAQEQENPGPVPVGGNTSGGPQTGVTTGGEFTGGDLDIRQSPNIPLDANVDARFLDETTVTFVRVVDGKTVPILVIPYDWQTCTDPIYTYLFNYALVIEITSLNFDNWYLSDTVGWLNVRFGGQNYRVQLPTGPMDFIPPFETMALYVAKDGSTYYVFNDLSGMGINPHTHDMGMWADCDAAGTGCPSLTPPLAYVPTNLAGAASATPSVEPLLIHGDTIDPIAGLNQGLLDGLTNNNIYTKITTVETKDPYLGFDELNSSLYMLGHHECTPYPATCSYLLYDGNSLQVGTLDCPQSFQVLPYDGATCDLNPATQFDLIIDGLRFISGAPVPMSVVHYTTKALPAGYTPRYCLPPLP